MLTLVSCMCPNLDSFYQGLAARLSERLERDVRFVTDGEWDGRLEMLRTGGASLGSVCGLQYVNEVDSGRAGLVPLAAPAPAGERYGGRPVYFTEMLVAAESGLSSFASLAGARWAYNEPTSHSGFGVVGYELARRGLTFGHFGAAVESGSHLDSLEMLLAGAVDVISVDSTVLDLEVMRSPALARQVRSVATLGPSPFPPLVAHGGLPDAVRSRLRDALTSLDRDERGAPLLREAMFERLAPVDDAWYAEIRRMRDLGRAAGGAPA